MSKKRIITAVILSVIIALTLGFIWGNSVFSKSESAKQSNGVFAFLKPMFDVVFGEGVITAGILRKMAHYFEYAVLGAEVYSLFVILKIQSVKNYLLLLIFGFFVGGTDEIIQIFSNRGSQFIDVLLDFSGYLLPALFFIIIRIINVKKRKRIKE